MCFLCGVCGSTISREPVSQNLSITYRFQPVSEPNPGSHWFRANINGFNTSPPEISRPVNDPNPEADLIQALNRLIDTENEPEIIEVNLSLPPVFYNQNEKVYNLDGEKFGYIFCHESYMNTVHFKRPPRRDGTRGDADLLTEIFELYGFRFKIYYDMSFEQIYNILSRVSQQDHTRTSCLWVTIMTYATSNSLLAADRPYEFSKLEFLLRSANLAGIPKILTLPYIRGGIERPGYLDRPPPQPLQNVSCSAICTLPYNAVLDLWYGCFDLGHQFYDQVFKTECVCPVCAAKNVDDGRTVRCASGDTIVLPSTADFIFLHAANNDLNSISILIRAISEAFKENQEFEHGDLIPIVNQKVANFTDPTVDKVVPESRITLTKTLRFKRIQPTVNGTSEI